MLAQMAPQQVAAVPQIPAVAAPTQPVQPQPVTVPPPTTSPGIYLKALSDGSYKFCNFVVAAVPTEADRARIDRERQRQREQERRRREAQVSVYTSLHY